MMLCAVLFAGACTQDSPTETGSGLLPPNTVRTFEVVLGPDAWLQWDTAFNVYSATADADFLILANSYRDGLDSRALLRYQIPTAIVVVDTTGITQTDSVPNFFEGELRFLIDTVASVPRPATVGLYRATESWDRFTATWTMRVDTPGVQVPWTQPGGSPGAFVGNGTVFIANDTVSVPIDSATIHAWRDTTDAGRGAVLTAETPGARVRTNLPTLIVRARSTFNPDTVIELSLAPNRTFIYSPEQPEVVGTPRVGGTPAYRTMLRLRERLDTITAACPGVPGCSIRLGDAAINYAAILLQPVPAPDGLAPELPMLVDLHGLIPSPLVPIQRSPVTSAVGQMRTTIPPSSFVAPGAPVVELPATNFFRVVLNTPAESQADIPSHIALLAAGPRTLGFATFETLPSLRLVISLSRELQLP